MRKFLALLFFCCAMHNGSQAQGLFDWLLRKNDNGEVVGPQQEVAKQETDDEDDDFLFAWGFLLFSLLNQDQL